MYYNHKHALMSFGQTVFDQKSSGQVGNEHLHTSLTNTNKANRD
jgi:hypothetical protein